MKRLPSFLLSSVIALISIGATCPIKPPKPPDPPQVENRPVGFHTCTPQANLEIVLPDSTHQTAITDDAGYGVFLTVPVNVPYVNFNGTKDGYIDYHQNTIPVQFPSTESVDVFLGNECNKGTDNLYKHSVRYSLPWLRKLPPPPSRDAILGIQMDFQGYDCDINSDGTSEIIWEPYLPKFSQSERENVYKCKAAHVPRDTHIDLTLDTSGLASLDTIIPLMQEALAHGYYIVLHCMGDGNNHDEPDHDDGALGYSWLMSNFGSIVARIKDAGLFQYTIFIPGYDGVVPHWQPWTRVNEFSRMARGVLGNDGYLGIEMAGGYGHSWSGENDDFATDDGKNFDVILLELPLDYGSPDHDNLVNVNSPCPLNYEYNFDAVWQIAKRVSGPNWLRPSNQPSCDDPGFYNGGPSNHVTPRGPYYVIMFEYDTYFRVRLGQLTTNDVIRHRNYFKSIGYKWVN